MQALIEIDQAIMSMITSSSVNSIYISLGCVLFLILLFIIFRLIHRG